MGRPEERSRIGALEGWFSITGNLLLAVMKGLAGLMTGSVALLADAVHTASDISSSLAVLIGFRLARKKPDREHPFGHGRVEYFTGLFIGIMLIGAGLAFVYSAFDRLKTGAYMEPGTFAVLVVLLSILLKEFMFHFSYQLGKLIDSDALIGDAWHHRSDALSSGAVLIALGGSYFALDWLDSVVAVAVSVFVIYAGLQIARNSCNRLLGTAPSREMKEGVINCALETKGVISAHDLEVHDYGHIKSVILHIEVEGTLSVIKAHGIATKVEDKISKKFSCSAVVHLDPVENKSSRGALHE